MTVYHLDNEYRLLLAKVVENYSNAFLKIIILSSLPQKLGSGSKLNVAYCQCCIRWWFHKVTSHVCFLCRSIALQWHLPAGSFSKLDPIHFSWLLKELNKTKKHPFRVKHTERGKTKSIFENYFQPNRIAKFYDICVSKQTDFNLLHDGFGNFCGRGYDDIDLLYLQRVGFGEFWKNWNASKNLILL